jgi:anti-sigma-K factor RskA
LDDLIGAYLLDALSEEERDAFEAHLRESEAARREVAHLRPVVDLLPLALEPAAGESGDEGVAPSPGLRDRIIAAVRDEVATDSAEETPPAEPARVTALPPPPPARPVRAEPTPLRPPGRIRPGRRPAAGDGGGLAAFGGWRLAAAVLAVIAVAALIWALTLQGRIGDLEDERDGYRATIVAGGGGSTGTLAYIMVPAPGGPETGRGVLYPIAPGADTARLDVIAMPPLTSDRVYQLWFVDLDEAGQIAAPPDPSVTFSVGVTGDATGIEVPLPAEPFDAVAVTAEPAGGSETPTEPILLVGTQGAVAG